MLTNIKLPLLLFKRTLATLFALSLAACGGGGGSPGATSNVSSTTTTTPVTKPAPTITLTLVDSTGTAKTALTTARPLTARAVVKDADGKPLADTIVKFAVGPNLSTLAPQDGSALTSAAGTASVVMSVKSLEVAQAMAGAADTISAAVTIGDQVLTATSNYSLGSTAITLRLVEPNPASIALNAYDTTPIKVDVFTDGVLYTAQPVSVNFTSACANGKADLPASANTINGRAQVVYRDKGCSANDTVTASVPGAPAVSANLMIAAPVAASIGFVSATPSDKAIVIKGAGGNGRTETAVLTFQAFDTFGNPLPNQTVNFSVNPANVVVLQANSATTGADGKVIVAVNSASTPTTFRVSATLASGQTTISDTVTVTTGQPVQTAFSISAESFNIEGWDVDNVKTKLNALLADSAGNPVADGTPVVFQTDSGAVGSSAIGGCLTVNGGCSVDFRSQAPRFSLNNPQGKRPGMATITVSSTSASFSLTQQIAVFLSGSTARINVNPAGPLSTTNCGYFPLTVEIIDANGNPMPIGTTVAVVNTDKVTVGQIFPATVMNIPPRKDFFYDPQKVAPQTDRQFSSHLIPLKPDEATCKPGAPNIGVGAFSILITSPLGLAVAFPFSLKFPVF